MVRVNRLNFETGMMAKSSENLKVKTEHRKGDDSWNERDWWKVYTKITMEKSIKPTLFSEINFNFHLVKWYLS